MELYEYWLGRVESRLRELFKPGGPPLLREAMGYYLFQKGKRIRPLMTLAVSYALGGSEEDALTVGCVIEMIHNYTLIHDDLPAMDNDDFRRGLPTCHRKFGEAVAILAGDALLTYAFEVLSQRENFRELSEEDILDLIRVISQKAGAGGVVGGQVFDIEGHKDIEETNRMKTASLFEACFLCGGIVAKRRDLLKDLENLGRKVGILFQITDDILDQDGYVKIFGLRQTMERSREIYEEVKRDLVGVFGEKSSVVGGLVDMIYEASLKRSYGDDKTPQS